MFYTVTVISLMAHYRGWVGGKGGVGGADSGVVCLVCDRNRLNLQDKSRQSLAAIW